MAWPIDRLSQLSILEATLLMLLGLLYLFFGWQAFSVILTASGALAGAAAGYFLSGRLAVRPYILMSLLAILGGLVALPARRAMVFLLAGMSGGGIGLWVFHVWTGEPYHSAASIVAGVAGFVVLGILGALFTRPVVIAVSAVAGAFACSWSVASIARRLTPGDLRPYWRGIPIVMVVLGVVLLVLGIAFQASDKGSGRERREREEAD